MRTPCGRPRAGDRLNTLTIHHGRHTFISHALAGGRTLAEVRDATRHANESITSAYLHVLVDDEGVGGRAVWFLPLSEFELLSSEKLRNRMRDPGEVDYTS